MLIPDLIKHFCYVSSKRITYLKKQVINDDVSTFIKSQVIFENCSEQKLNEWIHRYSTPKLRNGDCFGAMEFKHAKEQQNETKYI